MTQQHLQTEEALEGGAALKLSAGDKPPPYSEAHLRGLNPEAEIVQETHLLSEQAEPMETVGDALSQESRKFRREILLSMGGMSLVALLIVSGELWFGAGGWSNILSTSTIISCALSLLLLFSLLIVRSARKPRQRRRDMATKLVAQGDVRSVGPLVDALHLDDGMTREVASRALIDLLPRLKASDAHLLNEAQRAMLCQILNKPVESPLYKDIRGLFQPAEDGRVALRVAILQAFEQVGDSKAVPVVERLAKGEARTAGEKRIQEAAESCLPALQMRAELERSSQTLLRAAMPSSDASDTLLRAAQGAQDTAPEQLLRASDLNSSTHRLPQTPPR